MTTRNLRRELVFALHDVARLFRTYADQQVRQFGMTRAQWAVLSKLERHEGLKQSELAESLDLQPITLTRLIDRLCDNGLIERRPDPDDRRAKRLFLTAEARPLMERLGILGAELMDVALEGIEEDAVVQMRDRLDRMKENLRAAIADKNTPDKVQLHG